MMMKATISPGMFCYSLVLFSCLAVSTVTTDNDVRKPPSGNSASSASGKHATLFLLTGYEPPLMLKKAEAEDGDDWPLPVAQLPPKPLPQTMLPRNVTADALKPPLGAAQVAPPPRQLVDVDVCRGYFDVMGHFDSTFNCSKGSYIYCCGTCHYRFCCEHQRNRLDQDSCTNYKSPDWADPQVPVTLPADNRPDPDFETLQQQSSSTAYVIGGVISFTLVAAVGVRIAFAKVARRPRNRDANMPRSLVDILRHQSSPVQHGERNNMLTTADGRPPKNLYTPILQSKDNRKRGARMNNMSTPQLSSGPKLIASSGKSLGGGPFAGSGMRHSTSHASFSHSLHNLAQLPPSYEAAVKPQITRYSSLKKLERELDEYPGYSWSKRRSTNAPPSFYSSQHQLPWAGDYMAGSSRGTLPLDGSRPRPYVPPSTPNPYPLPVPAHYAGGGFNFERPPRRVRSQDQLLALGEGNTLSRLLKNQQQQHYYRNMRGADSQTLRRSHERLLMSPDRLEDQLLAMGLMVERGGGGGGMVPTMGRLSHHHKAQSQQNICATPSMERHHMVKMNSHPTPGHEHGGWEGHPTARRSAFANMRQNTVEQLHFIPGGGGGRVLRTASKNEVTV
ncbi:protein shisa-7-like [Hippocampus comes]|uniref:protein shisa-7-like n=1 Tax=Hippocampus comes TaxID=109280 RepID=UPI00094E2AC3|nr:PREDICTED: protein shisa-7-like [Hippocampus comes]